MSTTESLLLRAIALHTQESIAQATGLSTSQINRIATGQAGVTLEHIGEFLGAIGYRLIAEDDEQRSIGRDELDALRTLAGRYLDAGAETKTGI